MSVPIRHVLHQGPVLAAMARTIWESLRPDRPRGGGPVATPGPSIEATVPPRPRDLVRDFVRHVGGDPAAYAGVLPPHFFPQYAVPLLSRTLVGVPYDLTSIMNAGCAYEVRDRIPMGEPIQLRARLEAVDDDGRRVLFHQRLVAGVPSAPEALVVEQTTILPPRKGRGGDEAGQKDGKGDAKKDRARVPEGLREVGRVRIGARAGLDFAILTGDFNPLHTVPAYARRVGHGSAILHGFGTMARAVEVLTHGLWSGDPWRLRRLEVRFTRPLVMPADVGVYAGDDGTLAVGDAPGGPAYLVGRAIG